MIFNTWDPVRDEREYQERTRPYGKFVKLKTIATEVTGEDISGIFLANSENDRAIKYRYFHRLKLLKTLSKKGTYSERIRIIEDFNKKMERCYNNDSRSVLVNEHTSPHARFEPTQVTIVDNLVVQSGLTKLAEIFVGDSNSHFTFLEVGTSPIGLNHLNISNVAPHYRVNVQDLGWFEPSGNRILTGSMFPADMPSATIREIACFDGPTDPSTMFWRVVIELLQKALRHTVNETYAVISHIHTLKGK